MLRRVAAPVILCLTLCPAWGGEIIFVDPVREKAQNLPPPVNARARTQQSLEHSLESARERVGRGRTTEIIYLDDNNSFPSAPPAAERAGSARDYLDGLPHPPPTVILKSGPPPNDAARARESARSWIAPPPPSKHPDQCRTENIVGGIEGQPQGHTVIQSSKGGVTVCK